MRRAAAPTAVSVSEYGDGRGCCLVCLLPLRAPRRAPAPPALWPLPRACGARGRGAGGPGLARAQRVFRSPRVPRDTFKIVDTVHLYVW